MNIGERIKTLRKAKGMTLEELGKHAGIGRTTIMRYETGVITRIPSERIEAIANALNTTPAFLMGWDEGITVVEDVKIYNIPTYESVSAGFGAYASDEIVDYTPLPFRSACDAEQSICIKVKGDSMYPKIENGDTVVVRKVSSVDSGTIAVVLIDGEEGVVKRVTYGKDWINLESINPMYPVRTFSGADVQRLSVVGRVTKIIKEL